MQTYRFGDFELDLDASQLRLCGEPVRLERRPLDLLILLVSRHGCMVPREEIISVLWPAKVIIDFDSGLNILVAKTRNALGDSSNHPQFIETVPGRGYRFIAPVDEGANFDAAPEQPAAQDGRSGFRPLPVVALLLIVLAASAVFVWQAVDIAPSLIPGPNRDTPPTAQYDLGATTLAVLPFRTPASDEASTLLAQSVTDLVRNRLAALEHLTVVATSSTSRLIDSRADMRSIGENLHTRFLLTGDVDRTGARLRLDVQLVDAHSDKQLWSNTFDTPLSDIAAMREVIYQQVASALRIPVETGERGVASAEISLEAYQLYLRGQQLLASSTAANAETARELFSRATILDPNFARAYLGLGQALVERAVITNSMTRLAPVMDAGNVRSDLQTQAAKAFDRALELNPSLGEAWIEHARLTLDAVEAEALYRKGLDLAPNDGAGYVHYANFLFREGRTGEAIETTARASRMDPLTPELQLLHAFFLLVVRGDVAEHDRLVREALENNPMLPNALRRLANSRWELSGEFADAAQLIERAIAIEPNSPAARSLGRDIYLDLGDPAMAAALLGDAPPVAAMEIAQYEGDRARAANLLTNMPLEDWQDTGARASMAEAARDGGYATGDYQPVLTMLESVFAIRAEEPLMWHRAASLVFAHTLILAGEVERGQRLAESTLALIDTHSAGRVTNSFSRERAAAFAVLGENGRALDQLAIAVKDRKLSRWWYLAGRDPLYEHLRRDPRFQEINAEAWQHIESQRNLLEEMLRNGDIVTRTK